MKRVQVGVVETGRGEYPSTPPYHPSEPYPEYPFKEPVSEHPNAVYAGVRDLFHLLGLDRPNFGKRGWNPLGHLVKPGMTVAIKPNYVRSSHFEGKDRFCMITHPSVLRAIADYCCIALKGQGRILFADTPQNDCHYEELPKVAGLNVLCEFYSSQGGPQVAFRDLRNYWTIGKQFPSKIRPLAGDPEGSVQINLGQKSAMRNHPHPEKLYGAVYHRQETIANHTGDQQRYEVSGTILKADVVISVPKMKVHKKVGVTVNGKGLVGICTNKNLIVHYTLGSPSEGGDQYPEGWFNPMQKRLIKLERWMYDHLLAPRKIPLEYLHRSTYWLHEKLTKPLGLTVGKKKRLLDAGNWYGNDSCWRMAVDLMRIIHFSDTQGNLHSSRQRGLFSVVDGIVGGENNGPLLPDPKPVGVLVGGDNFLAVDLVTTRLMGFDYRKLKQFFTLRDPAFDFGVRDVEQIEVLSDNERIQRCFSDQQDRLFAFRPHPGWVGQIEI